MHSNGSGNILKTFSAISCNDIIACSSSLMPLLNNMLSILKGLYRVKIGNNIDINLIVNIHQITVHYLTLIQFNYYGLNQISFNRWSILDLPRSFQIISSLL